MKNTKISSVAGNRFGYLLATMRPTRGSVIIQEKSINATDNLKKKLWRDLNLTVPIKTINITCKRLPATDDVYDGVYYTFVQMCFIQPASTAAIVRFPAG